MCNVGFLVVSGRYGCSCVELLCSYIVLMLLVMMNVFGLLLIVFMIIVVLSVLG